MATTLQEAQQEADDLALDIPLRLSYPKNYVRFPSRNRAGLRADKALEALDQALLSASMDYPGFLIIELNDVQVVYVRKDANGNLTYRTRVYTDDMGQFHTTQKHTIAEPAWRLATPAIPPPAPTLGSAVSQAAKVTYAPGLQAAIRLLSTPVVTLPAKPQATISSGPPCPKCSRPMTLLFISAVCDHCNPPT